VQISTAIFFGLTQGISEFLPVSSSGHLLILQHFFGFRENPLIFDLLLHLATLLAVIVFFWPKILRLVCNLRTLSLLLFANLLTACIALPAEKFFWQAFAQPKLVGIGFLITALWLILPKFFSLPPAKEINFKQSLGIGLAQGIAVMPGISRSGATVSTALCLGLEKETAFAFSFIVSLPAILGANLLKLREISFQQSGLGFWPLCLALIFAFASGLLALKIFSHLLKKGNWYYFSFYCLILGLLVILRNWK
jgi:undecaprenyl-diphosphatase